MGQNPGMEPVGMILPLNFFFQLEISLTFFDKIWHDMKYVNHKRSSFDTRSIFPISYIIYYIKHYYRMSNKSCPIIIIYALYKN